MGEWIGFSIMLLFSIGCYVLSGFFLHGKGACLIAGYNTMSKKQQEQYDGRADDYHVLFAVYLEVVQGFHTRLTHFAAKIEFRAVVVSFLSFHYRFLPLLVS